MAPRKYRQVGYQDVSRSKGPRQQRGPQQPRSRASRDELRPAPEPIRARVQCKCTHCGAELSVEEEIAIDARCESCDAPLHSCVNCRFFDRSAPNECSQPLEAPIELKRSPNSCPLFKIKMTVALTRETTSTTSDARQAFDALFKKI